MNTPGMVNTRFYAPATYGQRLQIQTSIQEWRDKVLIQKHVVLRGDVVICEGLETRAFCVRHPDAPERHKAIPIPQGIKALCL